MSWTKNYKNRIVFDGIIQKNKKMDIFFRHGVVYLFQLFYYYH